jgi:hypothetical protein
MSPHNGDWTRARHLAYADEFPYEFCNYIWLANHDITDQQTSLCRCHGSYEVYITK